MGSGDREDFSRALNDARKRLHISISQAGAIAGVPKATVQGWLDGRYLPTPALRPSYLALVEALELTSELPAGLWDAQPGSSTDTRAHTTPYLGLRPFSTADRDLYFGRRAAVDRIITAIREVAASDGAGIVALVGPSGSGKSSLLAAGLAAAESADGALPDRAVRWFQASEGTVADEAPQTSHNELILVDQFEDILRLGPEQRPAKLARILALGEQHLVVIALRSDAWAEASEIPDLQPALSRPVLVTSMTQEELRDVITEPPRLMGVEVEPGLVAQVTRELVADQTATIPNDILPLLSTALLATWRKGRGRRMSLADYQAAGGVAQAIGELAEQAMSGLADDDRPAVSTLFLRLVRVTEAGVNRSPVPLAQLSEQDRRVMAPFVNARLLTVDESAVQISHDALLRYWGQLESWIEERQEDLRVRQQVDAAARLWANSDRASALLVPVGRLGMTPDWLADTQRRSLLSALQQEYVTASEQHFALALDEERLANRRLQRRGRLALTFGVLATCLAIVAGSMATHSRGLQLQADVARQEAQSRQVALAARSIRSNDPNLEAQMALVSARVSDTVEGRSALLDAAASDTPRRWLGSPAAVVAVNPSGDLVARVNGSGEVTLWRGDELNTSAGTTSTLDPDHGSLYAAALFTSGGRELLAAGGAVAGLWDVSGERPVRLADLTRPKVTTYAAAFSRDGASLALGGSDGRVDVLRVDGTNAPTAVASLQINPSGETAAVSSLAFDATGTLWVGGRNDLIDRWRIGATVVRQSPVAFHYGTAPLRALSVDVTADGSELAAATTAKAVLRWRADGGKLVEQPPLKDFGSWVNDVTFSLDGSQLAVGSSDQTTRVFETADGSLLRSLPGPSLVTGVQFAGSELVTASSDGILRVWPADSPLVRRSGGAVYNLSTDATGSTWLAGGTLSEGTHLWRLTTGSPQAVALEYPKLSGARSAAVAVAPDASFLVSASKAGELISWPLTADGPGVPTVVDSGLGYISCVVVSPDSHLVAAMGYGGTKAMIYRAASDGRLTRLSEVSASDAQMGAFSADSSVLAIALAANQVQLWTGVSTSAPSLASTISGFSTATIAVAAAPRTARIAVGEDSGAVSVWSIADPGHPTRTHLLEDAHASAYALAFSPDETTLAAASGDDVIWGWDLGSGTARFDLDGQLDRPWDVKYLDNGAALAAAGNNGGLRLWPAAEDAARQQVCAERGDPLTDAEWKHYLTGVTPFDPCG